MQKYMTFEWWIIRVPKYMYTWQHLVFCAYEWFVKLVESQTIMLIATDRRIFFKNLRNGIMVGPTEINKEAISYHCFGWFKIFILGKAFCILNIVWFCSTTDYNRFRLDGIRQICACVGNWNKQALGISFF